MSASAALAAVGRRFRIDGDFLSADPYGTGHINQTFLARYRERETERRYIHQRINDRVFSDIPALMSNVGRVTRHIRGKGLTLVPEIVPTTDGTDIFQADDGSWWRTYAFVEGAHAREIADRPEQAYQAARAFGRFAHALADLEEPQLHETLPSFHDTRKRYDAFIRAVERDAYNRASHVRGEIARCIDSASLSDSLAVLVQRGIARSCVTHNDTKLNNVLFDDVSGEGSCITDLDTVMPGIALYDFGDMVRTATMPVAEDERDLSLVHANPEMFVALARGYIEGAAGLISRAERDYLITSGMVITFEQGIRFLTDYLEGDTYYRTHRPMHNADRARTQLALLESLKLQEEAISRALDTLA